jgi:hypothetical protein
MSWSIEVTGSKDDASKHVAEQLDAHAPRSLMRTLNAPMLPMTAVGCAPVPTFTSLGGMPPVVLAKVVLDMTPAQRAAFTACAAPPQFSSVVRAGCWMTE